MEITITGRFGTCSRGRTTAKHADGHWGVKENGSVIIDAPGRWHLCTTDGFTRKKACDIRVADDGTISGMDSNFTQA